MDCPAPGSGKALQRFTAGRLTHDVATRDPSPSESSGGRAVDRLAERGGCDMHAGIEAQNGDNDTELRRENVPPEPKAAEQAVFR